MGQATGSITTARISLLFVAFVGFYKGKPPQRKGYRGPVYTIGTVYVALITFRGGLSLVPGRLTMGIRAVCGATTGSTEDALAPVKGTGTTQ